MKKNIPNILTSFRLILIPFILINILNNSFFYGLILILISGFTDILDGFLARKFNLISDIGKLLDPLADKLSLIFILLALSATHIIPLGIFIFVIVKEFLMIILATVLYKKKFVVSSKWYGKVTTCLFHLAIFTSLFFKIANISLEINYLIYYCAIGFALFSCIMYFNEFLIKYIKHKIKVD